MRANRRLRRPGDRARPLGARHGRVQVVLAEHPGLMDAVSTTHREVEGDRLRFDAGARTQPPADLPGAGRALRILVLDDDRAAAESCAAFLRRDGHDAMPCRRAGEALTLLERRRFDVVVLDLHLSGASGTELLPAVRARSPGTVVIATSAQPSVQESVAALRDGAWEYVPKPFSAAHLQLLVGRAALALGDSITGDEDDVAPHESTRQVTAILGASPAVAEVVRLARRVAATDAPVFITGESGTGKELMAEFIHRRSHRRRGPLVAINCAAIPETLLETEMFGHRRGAFTGAIEDRAGLLEAAHRGTFVLDELTQMPLGTQAKLLRAIQDGMVRRVGSNATDAVVDVRYIAVTNESPEEAIRAGRLREDLYYRLRVFPLHLPPLRERREDVPLLADHFVRHFWSRHRRGQPLPVLSERAQRALDEHAWRGNIRELQNVIEHGVVLWEPGTVIGADDIPFAMHPEDPRPGARDAESRFEQEAQEHGFHGSRQRAVARFERRYVEWVLERAGGNLSKAARIAGVQRTTLYRLMERHGFQRFIPVLMAGERGVPRATT